MQFRLIETRLLKEGLAEDFKVMYSHGISNKLYNALVRSFPTFKRVYNTIEDFKQDIIIRNTPNHIEMTNSQRRLIKSIPNNLQNIRRLNQIVKQVYGSIGSDADIKKDKEDAFKLGEDPKNLV